MELSKKIVSGLHLGTSKRKSVMLILKALSIPSITIVSSLTKRIVSNNVLPVSPVLASR